MLAVELHEFVDLLVGLRHAVPDGVDQLPGRPVRFPEHVLWRVGHQRLRLAAAATAANGTGADLRERGFRLSDVHAAAAAADANLRERGLRLSDLHATCTGAATRAGGVRR